MVDREALLRVGSAQDQRAVGLYLGSSAHYIMHLASRFPLSEPQFCICTMGEIPALEAIVEVSPPNPPGLSQMEEFLR